MCFPFRFFLSFSHRIQREIQFFPREFRRFQVSLSSHSPRTQLCAMEARLEPTLVTTLYYSSDAHTTWLSVPFCHSENMLALCCHDNVKLRCDTDEGKIARSECCEWDRDTADEWIKLLKNFFPSSTSSCWVDGTGDGKLDEINYSQTRWDEIFSEARRTSFFKKFFLLPNNFLPPREFAAKSTAAKKKVLSGRFGEEEVDSKFWYTGEQRESGVHVIECPRQ